MFSRPLLLIAALTLSLSALPARAAEKQPYSAKAFTEAQNAGHSILVEIFAPWCPTCKAQAPILEKLEGEPKFKNLHVFRVDFDSQKDALKSFNANTQSTLIVFKGPQEAGRSVGETDPASISALLDKSL